MPALAVRHAAAPCRCLRPAAGGRRRACDGGNSIRKAAEQGGGQDVRGTAAPIQLARPLC